jgi:hypothetical protein
MNTHMVARVGVLATVDCSDVVIAHTGDLTVLAPAATVHNFATSCASLWPRPGALPGRSLNGELHPVV